MEDKAKYVWLNLNTGEFSNAWDKETNDKYIDEEVLEQAKKDNYKLIKFECLNDENFEFYNLMKIVTKPKK